MHRSKVGDTSLVCTIPCHLSRSALALVCVPRTSSILQRQMKVPSSHPLEDERNKSGYGGTVPGIALDIARHGNFEIELTGGLYHFSPFWPDARLRAKNVSAVNEDS